MKPYLNRVLMFYIVFGTLLLSSCGKKPDLVVTKLETVGPASMNIAGDIELPVRVVVRNQGTAWSGKFMIAAEYTVPRGVFKAVLTTSENSQIPVLNSLAPGGEAVVYGVVTIPAKEYGWTIALKARAFCFSQTKRGTADEQGEELYHDNNESLPIQVSLALSDW